MNPEDRRPETSLPSTQWKRYDYNNQKPGDWTCPQCGYNCFARRLFCGRCNTTKPQEGPSVQGQPRPSAFERRTGDWDCPNCNYCNFASRHRCGACQMPRS